MDKGYAAYILASEGGVLYVGVTGNLSRRLYEHQSGVVPGFTSRYRVSRLVWYEIHDDIRAAIAREKQIKGWRREKKVALVEATNPVWADLSAQVGL